MLKFLTVGILFKKSTKIISLCNKLHAFTFCAHHKSLHALHVMHMLKKCKCGGNFLRLEHKGKCLPHILDNTDIIHAKKFHFRGIWAIYEIY